MTMTFKVIFITLIFLTIVTDAYAIDDRSRLIATGGVTTIEVLLVVALYPWP